MDHRGKQGIDAINSITNSDYQHIEIKRDTKIIAAHYEGVIKPILLSYHYGTLYSNRKYDFLSYIVKIVSILKKKYIGKMFSSSLNPKLETHFPTS
jgi:hypothetical protein